MQEQQATNGPAIYSNCCSSNSSSSGQAEPVSTRQVMSPSPELESSGYCSEADISEYHQLRRNDGEPSSISSDSSDYNSDAENEDIDSQISFLKEKQLILKRAFALFKEEENYDASRARLILAGKISRGSPIWLEAKEVLEDLEEERSESQASPKKVKTSTECAWTLESCKRDPNHPKIDLSSVIRISSADVGDDLIAAVADAIKRDVLSVPFAITGPWMAKMLVRCLPSIPATTTSTKPADSVNWVIVNDPSMGPIVVPPSTIPFQNKIHLKEAIACTSVAQLITQSTPPFRVVHANKAFSEFSGRAASDVIGKPIEALVQAGTTCSEESPTTSEPAMLLGNLFHSSNQPCRVSITPVMDQSKDSQEGMSHLLIRVTESDHGVRNLHPFTTVLSKSPLPDSLPVFGAVG